MKLAQPAREKNSRRDQMVSFGSSFLADFFTSGLASPASETALASAI
jgi:hypothetical protein